MALSMLETDICHPHARQQDSLGGGDSSDSSGGDYTRSVGWTVTADSRRTRPDDLDLSVGMCTAMASESPLTLLKLQHPCHCGCGHGERTQRTSSRTAGETHSNAFLQAIVSI